jgi:hypothetical protein
VRKTCFFPFASLFPSSFTITKRIKTTYVPSFPLTLHQFAPHPIFNNKKSKINHPVCVSSVFSQSLFSSSWPISLSPTPPPHLPPLTVGSYSSAKDALLKTTAHAHQAQGPVFTAGGVTKLHMEAAELATSLIGYFNAVGHILCGVLRMKC